MPSSDEPDIDSASRLSEAELYRIVHEATQDAILGAIGTVLWVGIGVVLFFVGVQLVVGSLSLGPAVVGAGVAVGGLGIVARALNLGPAIRG